MAVGIEGSFCAAHASLSLPPSLPINAIRSGERRVGDEARPVELRLEAGESMLCCVGESPYWRSEAAGLLGALV